MVFDFRACLETIFNEVPGAVAATLMAADGLPVESIEQFLGDGEEPVDVPSLLVEYSSVLGQVSQSAQVFAAGELEEISIQSERLTTIIRPVTGEYFLALALRPGASTGKARYLLRITAPRLVDELA